MYLTTGLRGVFIKPRYKPPRLSSVTVRWGLEVPFRKDFGAFHKELSKAIRQLVTAEIDKKFIDRYLSEDMVYIPTLGMLKAMHGQLLKQQSPKLKDSDPIGITAEIGFQKQDYTGVYMVVVSRRD